MINFEDVSIHRDSKSLISGVSFSCAPGERIVFYGPSGSGKTTVLNALAGIIELSGGKIVFQGQRISPKNILSVRQSVSYIGQEPALGADTVEEALMLPYSFSANKGKEPEQGAVMAVLESVRLKGDILKKECSVISGGEKQRVAIARELLLGKKVFLLDEVTSALDPASKQAVISLFKSPDYTLLSISHDPEWFAVGTRFIRISDGTIVYDGVKKEEEGTYGH